MCTSTGSARACTWLLLGSLLGTAQVAGAATTADVEVLVIASPSAVGATVVLHPLASPGVERLQTIGTDGAPAVFHDLSPGPCLITISLTDHATATVTIPLMVGTVSRVEARLEATAASSVRLVGREAKAGATLFDEHRLRALPSSPSLWALADTAGAGTIADRIDGGGLWIGEAALVGSRGNSWTQASIRVGEIDATDPVRTGTPLVFADPAALDAIVIDAGVLPADQGGPGTTLTLVPRRPGPSWRGSARVAAMPRGLQAGDAAGGVPSIARLESQVDAGGTLGGPLARARAGIVVSGRFTRVRRVERDDPGPVESRVGSAFAHLLLTPRPTDELRILTSVDSTAHPYAGRARVPGRAATERDTFWRVQGAWARAPEAGARWTIAGAYQRSTVSPSFSTAAAPASSEVVAVVDRLRDGPVPALFDPYPGARDRLDARIDVVPELPPGWGRRHAVQVGGAVARAGATTDAAATGPVAETVGVIAARLWEYGYVGPQSRWSATDYVGYASDRVALSPNLSVDVGLRFELTRGSARGAVNGISWGALSPRLAVRWQPDDGRRLAVFAHYARYRYRLPLHYLAFGDPTGPKGLVYRWDDLDGDGRFGPGERGPLVAAVGPCCAGDAPNTIDPDLAPPHAQQVTLGVERRFGQDFLVRFAGVDRRDRDLVVSVNTGVTPADYTVVDIPDPGEDWLNAADDRVLHVYNRVPASFGSDRYRLTNPEGLGSIYQGLELTLEKLFSGRWQMLFGATAYRAEGLGTNQGFRVNENDQSVPGALFEDPNAGSFADGRLFFDRAYVIKWAVSGVAPHDTLLGVVARYQDGQPFARVVVVPDLAQGAEVVQAYRRGRTRFTYTLTVDARVEKGFRIGAVRAAAILEAFNLLDLANEVEENAVTSPSFRAPTATQPPRTVRVGFRVDF